MIGFKYAGIDAEQKCLTCAHWRIQTDGKLKGAGKCAAATGLQDKHSFFSPHAVCGVFTKAHHAAITKRKSFL